MICCKSLMLLPRQRTMSAVAGALAANLLRSIILTLGLVAGASAGTDPVGVAEGELARLTATAPTEDYALIAREFGTIIDTVRQASAPDATLKRLRQLSKQMRDRTHERLRAAEAEAGDSEGALEQIYKSRTWDDLSFALSAFPYWSAWLDFTLAERPSQAAHRAQLLYHAKRGFRGASMQIFQPNLVYGGWLGLGYLANLEGQTSRATQIFEALKKALAADTNHPVYKMAEAELAVMRGGARPVMVPTSPSANASAANGDTEILHAEAMRLLQQHRVKEVGAREAAERIRKIIASNQMTMTILNDVLEFQKEIAREDLGEYTDLVLAEYNFNNQQWFTAVGKYKTFFQHEPRTPGLNFDRFRYRLAVAYLKSNLNDEAAREAEKLLRSGVEAEVQKAATKLSYIARAQLAENHTLSTQQAALATAAKRFLAASPTDGDADGARLILAQQSGDPGAALRYLNSVKATGRFAGGVERTRFYILAKDFAHAAQTGNGLEQIAKDAMSAWQELPADEKKSPQNQAFFMQLQAVLDPDPNRILKAIELAEQKNPAAGSTVLRAYLWSRLKLYERLGQPERLLADIKARGDLPIEAWRLEQYFPFVRKLKDMSLRVNIAEALAPRLKAQPEMERRFRLLQIEDWLSVNDGEKAYEAAKRLIKDYPRAGDAYRVLAKAAQQTKRFVEADNAWRIITEKVPPKQDIWWEGMLSRIEIRTGSTRPEAACELVTAVARRLPAPSDHYKSRFNALRQRTGCRVSAGA